MAILTEAEYHAALAKGEPAFRKKCRECGGEYFTSARNAMYCSEGCAKKGAEKARKRRQRREKRRAESEENREVNRALSRAYSLCEAVMDLYEIPRVCAHESGECSGELERHHINCNPFDNSPWNLEYLCKKHHAQVHAGMGSVNVVEALNESKREVEGLDDSGRSDGMVGFFRRRVEGVRSGKG